MTTTKFKKGYNYEVTSELKNYTPTLVKTIRGRFLSKKTFSHDSDVYYYFNVDGRRYQLIDRFITKIQLLNKAY